MAKIDNIEGIGPKYAKKLINSNIGTIDRLLHVAAHKRGREDLAEQTQVPEKLILKWVNRADLIRIKGIGEKYSNLLEEAGVDTVSELRQKHDKNLYKSLVEINREKILVRRIPSQRDVESWVKQAMNLQAIDLPEAGSNAVSKEWESDRNPPAQIYTDIISFFRVVIFNWWLIILVFAIGIGITFFVVRQQPRIYESQTTIIVSPRVGTDGSADILRSIDVMKYDVIGTYVQVLKSQTTLQNAINTLAGEFDQNDIQDAVIEIRPVENSAVIVIKTRSNSPALAYSISRELPNQVTADMVPNSLVNLYPIQVLDPATVPQTPVSPNVSLSYLLGGVGSLVLGVGFAFVWYSIKQSRNAVVDYEM